MIDVEQQLLAAQNADDVVILLQEELAMLQAERKARRGSLVFWPVKKTQCEAGDFFCEIVTFGIKS